MNSRAVANEKRILMIGNFFLSGTSGTQPVCERLAYRFIDAGWHVKTTSSRSSRYLRILDMLIKAFQYRREYDIAIVDVFSGSSFIWAEVAVWYLRRLGKSCVLTLRGGNLPRFAQRWPGRVKRLLCSAHAVTTPSYYLRENFVSWREDIHVLPNGLDLTDFEFRLRQRPHPNLTWLRAFHHIYNPTVMPTVVAQLVREFPELRLVMYGPDKKDGSLIDMYQKAKQFGVYERIHVHGPIPNTRVPEFLSHHDIFLNTTTAESFGVAVLEAAALGMCIVTTDVGELPYIWTEGEDALLVPLDDPDAMTRAIRRILTEPGLAERLSQNARTRAEQYDWNAVLPKWETVLKEARDAN